VRLRSANHCYRSQYLICCKLRNLRYKLLASYLPPRFYRLPVNPMVFIGDDLSIRKLRLPGILRSAQRCDASTDILGCRKIFFPLRSMTKFFHFAIIELLVRYGIYDHTLDITIFVSSNKKPWYRTGRTNLCTKSLLLYVYMPQTVGYYYQTNLQGYGYFCPQNSPQIRYAMFASLYIYHVSQSSHLAS
jgi:hypothetical protein